MPEDTVYTKKEVEQMTAIAVLEQRQADADEKIGNLHGIIEKIFAAIKDLRDTATDHPKELHECRAEVEKDINDKLSKYALQSEIDHMKAVGRVVYSILGLVVAAAAIFVSWGTHQG